jgi:Amt family ammonium transporter
MLEDGLENGIDFAGSSVVHSVGGWASLVAAALVGPRIV